MGEAHPGVNERTMVRLTLLCHASTSATKRAAFPIDEGLDAKGRDEAAALAGDLPAFDRALMSPAGRARETAEYLGLTATPHADLRDLDCGRWAGLTLAEVAAKEQAALTRWMSDPNAAPHGGEPVSGLLARVRRFLAEQEGGTGKVIAITHAAWLRAAIVSVLDAPAEAFWRIDAAPLSQVTLHGEKNGWRVRTLGRVAW